MVKNSNSKNHNIKILLDNLNNPDWSVRAKAVFDLRKYDDSKVIDALIEELKDENEMIAAANVDIKSTSSGTLELVFMNVALPAFDASTEVSVDIGEQGTVTFGTGTLNYEGEEDNGQFKIKRSGTLTLAPTGTTVEIGDDLRIDVKENTTVNERIQTWYWDGSSWISVLDENITDTWNGGLVFYRSEAKAGGSTVQVVADTGSVTWTLQLDPDQ